MSWREVRDRIASIWERGMIMFGYAVAIIFIPIMIFSYGYALLSQPYCLLFSCGPGGRLGIEAQMNAEE